MALLKQKIQFKFSSILIFVSIGVTSCADAEFMLQKILGKNAGINDEEYVPVPGNPSTEHLSKTLSNESLNSSAQVQAMDIAIEDKARTNLIEMGLMLDGSQTAIAASSEAFDTLQSAEKKKRALTTDNFQKLDNDFFHATTLVATDYTGDTVAWGSTSDASFTIPALDRMPVRDQGRRGTCASFAGIGLIESLIIQANSASLPFKEIDLSEQRFYYLSKPESWANGGSTSKQGSDSGTGFARSNGLGADYPAPTDTGGSTYNIPLEKDCPYNSKVGTTDLQTPLAEGCKTKGLVRISKFTSWAGNQGTANNVQHAQQIYNELRLNKSVVVYTKLSSNWEHNDGIITYKDSGGVGATGHASGHAYLIVGARKIDETAFPGEGGLCFIIRNSWGTGWGANGLSCMTLKWFNNWRSDTVFPTVDEVQLIDGAGAQISLASARPSSLTEPDPSSKKNRKGGSLAKRKGNITISIVGGSASFENANPWFPISSGNHEMKLVDPANLVADDLTYGKMIADNNQAYKILYAASSTQLILRGILNGENAQTHNLELIRSGSNLIISVEGRGDVQVGEFTEAADTDGAMGLAVVCGRKYASICDLNYVEESNELVIGLSEIEARREISAPPYNWQTVQLAGYGVEMNRPESKLNKFDLRLINDGQSSEPTRLKLDPKSGNISHKGNSVGNLQNGSLCSGSYSSKCRVIKSGNKFEIFSKQAN